MGRGFVEYGQNGRGFELLVYINGRGFDTDLVSKRRGFVTGIEGNSLSNA